MGTLDNIIDVTKATKGGFIMARYLLQVCIKPEAYTPMIQNPQDRGEAVRPVFEAVGGRLEEYYFAVGENTVYVLCEVPDLTSLEALNMAVLAGGAIASIKATGILTAKEAVDVMKKAGDVVYRPPSK
jgi:uncharacterized protein with GYD domain